MKQCSKCKETKDFSEFFKSAGKPDGYQAYCKPCKRGHERDTHSVSGNRSHMIRRRYNMTLEEYDVIVKAQGGTCALCDSDDPGMGNVCFSIDHDHSCCPGNFSCGKCVRGLLCQPCNLTLGLFREDAERLARMSGRVAAYLSGTV